MEIKIDREEKSIEQECPSRAWSAPRRFQPIVTAGEVSLKKGFSAIPPAQVHKDLDNF
jgi:hypothetical protein